MHDASIQPEITIILPVYGRTKLLSSALDSVYQQDDPDWKLLIADDFSDQLTHDYLLDHCHDPRVTIHRRPKNIGLFANLNAAATSVQTEWFLILCSDDELTRDAIANLKKTILSWPGCQVILSSYLSIDELGNDRFDVNGYFYDQFAPKTALFQAQEILEHLLHYGSINGNITGMLINKSVLLSAGLWREDWSQVADWEWLSRACVASPILVSRRPIARVRVHQEQLSVANRKQFRELGETLNFVGELVTHPLLRHCRLRFLWAAYHGQFMLWNTIKLSPIAGFKSTFNSLKIIHKNIGLSITVIAFLLTLPARIKIFRTGKPLMPPV